MIGLKGKRSMLAAAAVAAGALGATTLLAAVAATPGSPAPAFSEPAADGKTVSLADFAGKTVVLEWTNDGCPFVKKHYDSGNMQKTQAAAIASGDVVWLSVISSKKGAQGYADAARANKLTAERGAKPTNVLLDADGSMGKAYGAKTTPQIYVISPDGKIAYNGAIDSIPSTNQADIGKATNYALEAVKAVKAGRKPDPAVSVPYGCSVKY
jgi:peroxiredoxin